MLCQQEMSQIDKLARQNTATISKSRLSATPGSESLETGGGGGGGGGGVNMSPTKKKNFLAARQLSKEQAEREQKEVEAINNEYKKIMDRVKNIDKIVDSMEDTTNELSQDVMAFELEYDSLEKEVKDAPLVKMTEMLEKWSKESIHTHDEIQKFAQELWVSLEEYEKDIKDGVQGHQMILSMKEYKYMNHIEWIKNKFGFYVELYEVRVSRTLIIHIPSIASLCGAEAEAKKASREAADGSLRA